MSLPSGGDERIWLLAEAADAAWAIVHEALAGAEAFAIETKSGPADLVTAVDRAVEARIRAIVLGRFPRDAFRGEELGRVNEDDAPWTWWVDPVDGTTNFAHRMPFASISIALARGDTVVAGTVVDAYSGERFRAVRGRGARVGGQTLRIEAQTGLAGAVVATELQGARPWPGLGAVLDYLAEAGATLRVMGSSALSLAHTAAGHAVACLISRPHPIDTAAGILLVEEAMGTVLRLEPQGEGAMPMLLAGSAAATRAIRPLLSEARVAP
jgi:myo-inositol-1(or 4)-monophosphatase